MAPDLPVEEFDLLVSTANTYYTNILFLVAPTTTTERLARISKVARSFVYIVAIAETTRVRGDLADVTLQPVKRVSIPKLVRFGISKPEHAFRVIPSGADRVIV